MKRIRFEHILIAMLVLMSVLFYALQEIIFHNPSESSYLFFQDLAFLPLNIVLVTFVLERVLRAREKRDRLEQINILIGAFFAETGTVALEIMRPLMDSPQPEQLQMSSKWTDRMFDETASAMRQGTYHAQLSAQAVAELKALLPQKKPGILAMFSNPNLLEHDTFTDTLWALYHLIDELESRADVSTLPASDIMHLGGDMVRAWGLLVGEWVGYTKHLKGRYPYLWSLAVRKNPFTAHRVVITEPPAVQ